MSASPSEHSYVPPAVADLDATTASVASPEAQSPQGVTELFGLSGPLFLAQLVNFAIVAAVVSRFVAKPILATLRERSRLIAENIDESDRLKSELTAAEKSAKLEHAKMLKESQAETDRLRRAAEAEMATRMKEAEEERAHVLAAGQEKLALERAKLVDDAAAMAAERMRKAVLTVLADADPELVQKSVEKAWQGAK